MLLFVLFSNAFVLLIVLNIVVVKRINNILLFMKPDQLLISLL